jgi:hypothetical protein
VLQAHINRFPTIIQLLDQNESQFENAECPKNITTIFMLITHIQMETELQYSAVMY